MMPKQVSEPEPRSRTELQKELELNKAHKIIDQQKIGSPSYWELIVLLAQYL